MGVHNRNKQYGFASVKPRDAEVVGGKFNKKKILAIILSVILVGLLAWGIVLFANKKDENNSNINVNISNPSGSDVTIETNKLGQNNHSASIVGGFTNSQTVKLALLANPNLFDYNNDTKLGCDVLVFSEPRNATYPKVLNSTLKMLFEDTFNYGFPPANFIALTQKDLKFDHAVIENGVAKVFLKGEMTIKNKECDSQRVVNQITQTSKQFSTVKSVEIYLNDKQIEL